MLLAHSKLSAQMRSWTYGVTLASCQEDFWRLVDAKGSKFNAAAAHARQIESWEIDDIATTFASTAPTAYRLIHDLLSIRDQYQEQPKGSMDTYWEGHEKMKSRVVDNESDKVEGDDDSEWGSDSERKQTALRKVVSYIVKEKKDATMIHLPLRVEDGRVHERCAAAY
jgi:hypothetical protein